MHNSNIINYSKNNYSKIVSEDTYKRNKFGFIDEDIKQISFLGFDNSISINGRDIYKIIAITILVIGFISGIIAGFVFPNMIYHSNGIPKPFYEESFNIKLMFIIWVSSSLISTFIFGIYSVCYRLDIISNQNKE